MTQSRQNLNGSVGRAPWGDFELYRREVFRPLFEGSAPSSGGPCEVVIAASDVGLVRGVLNDVYEGWSGGRPWSTLSADETKALKRVKAQLWTFG